MVFVTIYKYSNKHANNSRSFDTQFLNWDFVSLGIVQPVIILNNGGGGVDRSLEYLKATLICTGIKTKFLIIC